MKRLIKTLVCAFLSLALVSQSILTYPVTAAGNEVSVYLDGTRLVFDVPAQIIDGRTMAPLRAIFEAMGATVTWDDATRTATGVRGDTIVVLPVGSLYPTINGVVVPLDVPAQIVNGRTLAPLRFVGEAFGGSVTWDGATSSAYISTSDNTASLAGLTKTPVDFNVSESDLKCFRDDTGSPVVRAGIRLKLEAKVHKSTDVAACGFVVFTLDGVEADKVPFSMDATDDYVRVETDYYLPYDNFLSLAENDTVSTVFRAVVLVGDTNCETNSSDNTATLGVTVKGADIEPNDTIADARIDSISVVSDLGNNMVKPGEGLTFKANVSGPGGYYTRVFYYINDKLVGNKQCYLSKSANSALNTFIWYVPWSASGSLDLRIELENGAQMSMAVPVAPYDYQLRDQGVSWDMSGTTAGRIVTLRCRLFKDSGASFDPCDAMRLIFIVNGVPSEPVEPDISSSYAPYMAEAVYGYRIPENCSWPLDVKVVADGAGLFAETREGNNIASATVPQTAVGTEDPSLSVTSSGIWYYPSVLIPGETVQLFAAVHNDSVSSASGMTLDFSVNGVQIDSANATYRSSIKGGQYHVFYEKWTVPDGLTADPVFTFNIIPGSNQAGDDTSDNASTLVLPLAHPDLAVGEIDLVSTGSAGLSSGGMAALSAVINNYGAAPVSSANVSFLVDGASVAVKTVSIPARGSVQLAVPYQLGGVADDTAAGANITGFTGSVNLRGQGSLTYAVTVDPANLISESNESNNSAGPREFTVLTGSSRGVVMVQVKNLNYDYLSGAFVTISAGGKSATAVTDSYGYCTFLDVPFGAFEVTASCSGYNAGHSYDEHLYEGTGSDFVSVYLDNYSYVTGVVRSSGGSALANVKVEVDGTNFKTYTDATGRYTLKLPAGTYQMKYRLAGYAREDRSFDLPLSETKTIDVRMSATDLTYLCGYVVGPDYEPLSVMLVEAVSDSGTVLASAYTDLNGFYDMSFSLGAPYAANIKARVSGQGLFKEQGLEFYRGIETEWNFSFVPVSESSGTGDVLASADVKVTAWAECASVPSTFFTQGYEVDALYGTFEFDTFITATDSYVNYLKLDITPDYWNYNSVSGSWSPLDLISTNNDLVDLGINVVSMVFPTDIPISMGFHSSNKTLVYIKKISVMSDGIEIGEPIYPDATGPYDCAPNVQVNWDDCLIKYYLKVMPDDGAANPAEGYHYDRVLLIFNPKTKDVEITNYIVTGWDENNVHETYMDE